MEEVVGRVVAAWLVGMVGADPRAMAVVPTAAMAARAAEAMALAAMAVAAMVEVAMVAQAS